MGKQELSGQRIDDVLMLFGQKKQSARQSYREFVIAGIKQGQRNERAAICYLAVRECHFSGVAVARVLNMTRSVVSVAVKRGGEIVSRNPALRGKLVD